jgi:hypothetical protein
MAYLLTDRSILKTAPQPDTSPIPPESKNRCLADRHSHNSAIILSFHRFADDAIPICGANL